MALIFISYSRSDKKSLDELVPHLRAMYGTDSVWFDEELRTQGGIEWWNKIIAEIKHCQIFIYLMSDQSTESHWCQDELSEAVSHNKHILPIVLPTLRVNYPRKVRPSLSEVLKSKQYISIVNGIHADVTLASLLSSISKLINAETFTLSKKDRWFLSNQFQILSSVDPENKKEYEKTLEVIEGGYELHYSWLTDYINDGNSVMTRRDCLEVIDILDMFSELQDAYENLSNPSDDTSIQTIWIHFAGFDGNTETKQLQYTRFLIERDRKFEWLSLNTRFDPLNSHIPLLDHYRAMLQEYQKSAKPRKLTRDDLIRITNARSNLRSK
jgi:uncharacterized protein